MDWDGSQRERGSGRSQLQDLEPVLQGEKRFTLSHILLKHKLIILPQLYQTEVLFRSHDQMGSQGIDKVQQRTLHRFDWPGLRKACERLVNACLACLQVKDPRKMKFPLKSVESSEFNEIVQIDHQKICMQSRDTTKYLS